MSYSGTRSSQNSTANSAGPKDLYRCPHCPRTFSNGQALGGHQNAHRDRVMRKFIFTDVIDKVRSSIPSALATPASTHPLAVFSPVKNISGGDYRRMIQQHPVTAGLLAASSSGFHHDLNVPPPKEGADQLERSSERTLTDPIARVGDDVGRREQGEEVSSDIQEGLDLELRLGFGGL